MTDNLCGFCEGPVRDKPKSALGTKQQFCSDDCIDAFWKSVAEAVVAREKAGSVCACCGKKLSGTTYMASTKAGVYCSNSCMYSKPTKQ